VVGRIRGTGKGIYLSADGGETFSRVGNLPRSRWGRVHVTQIAFDLRNPQRIWLVGGEQGLWFSGDGGLSWRNLSVRALIANINASRGTVRMVAIHPRNGNILTVALLQEGAPGLLLRSVDGGKSWHLLLQASARTVPPPWWKRIWGEKKIRYHQIWSVAYNPRHPEQICAGLSHGLLLCSNDGGRSWQQRWRFKEGIVHIAFASTRTYAVTESGALWEAMKGQEKFVDITPRKPRGRLIAATRDAVRRLSTTSAGEVWISTPRGVFRRRENQWQRLPTLAHEDDGTIYTGLAPNPSRQLVALAAVNTLEISRDGGASWSVLRFPQQTVITRLAQSPLNPRLLLAVVE
jgi:photosystem II stability/assembly factor-like uncharacterized protein